MNIIKGNLAIRNATANDAEQLAAWWNDGAVMAHAGFPKGLGTTAEKVAADIALETDDTSRRHIIELYGKPIGEMAYHNRGDKTAEPGIKICDLTEQNKGHGTVLLSVFIDALYKHMGYEAVIISTNTNNLRAQKVYGEKLGFRKLRIEKDSWKDQLGQLQSFVYFSLSKEEWFVLHPSIEYGFNRDELPSQLSGK